MPHFITLVLVPGVFLGCIYGLVTIGFNVAEVTARVLNFAQGSVILWAPLAALVAWQHWGWPKWLALLFGVFVSIALNVLAKEIALRPFIGRPVSFQWLLSGLGVATILNQIAVKPYGGEQQAFPLSLSVNSYDVGGIRVAPQQMLLVGAMVGMFLVLRFLYKRTTIGHMLIAVGQDVDGAKAIGIPPQLMASIAFAISGATAAAAGLIAAPYLLVSPNLGFQLLFIGFVALMFGGITSIGGGLIGGLIVGVTVQATAVYIGAQWNDVVVFGFLIALYVARPTGLFGRRAGRIV